jgi:DNA-binding transcriptional regulator YhcF (GntR family)
VIVHIDASSPVPPYEQLRAQIATLVGSGVLKPGDQLPTIRQLAGDLGLAAGTVARAYSELDAAGVLDSRGRRGTFVTSPGVGPVRLSAAERSRRLAAAADAFATAVRQLGADPKVAIEQAMAAMTRG